MIYKVVGALMIAALVCDFAWVIHTALTVH